jgi:HEAT repeat protein
MHVALTRAWLRCAEHYASNNRIGDALAIYQRLFNESESLGVRRSALVSALNTGHSDAVRLMTAAIEQDDPGLRAAAIANSSLLKDPEVTGKLISALKTAQSNTQVLLVEALGRRDDPLVKNAITEATGATDIDVRIAAYNTLAHVGDASSAALLCNALNQNPTERQVDTILACLRRMSADGVDSAIVEALKGAEAPAKVLLIRVISDRRYRSASGTLHGLMGDKNPAVAKAALRAIGALGACQGMGNIIDLMLESSDAGIRSEAAAAIIAVTRYRQYEENTGQLILTRLKKVDSASEKCSLMRILPATPGEESLKCLQAACKDVNAEIRDCAVRAMARYPEPTAAETLLDIFETTNTPAHRTVALQGCIRLCRTTDMPAERAVKLYRQAMQQAATAAEEKLILSGLAEVAHPDALRMALSVMEQPAVKAEASLAVIALAQKTSAMDASLASTAAGKVLADPTLNNLHPRARSVIDMIKSFEDFILAWQVTGPYFKDNSNYSELFAVAFAPETASADVKWSPIPAGTDPKRPWILDLLKLYPGNSRVAYVKTSIKSPRKQQVVLELGSDDGNKAWLNGKLVHANNIARAAIPGSDKAKITLNEGWNKLMLKITQNIGPWEFCARIRNADGAKVEGIEIDCFHEGPLLVHEEGKQSKAAPIFDGETFAGWDGNLDIFRIEDEAIVGGTLKERIKRNEYLCSVKDYADFELRLKVKLLGSPETANAGIQIRSRRVAGSNEMVGYQADMGQHYWGSLYCERRHKVLAAANRPELDKVLKLEGWNDYRILCHGRRIRLWINGYQTVDYTELDESIEQTGVIGLQIHGGPAAQTRYRNIIIRVLK